MSASNAQRTPRVLITGGAGFIGTNLADRLAAAGHRVVLLDNLCRAGVERNVSWLLEKHGDRIRLEKADIRDARRVAAAVHSVDQVFHLAAQVAVTSSLVEPRHDFEVNVGGAMNVLEAIRTAECPPRLVFTSTNKVYGNLLNLDLQKTRTRYQPAGNHSRPGVDEAQPLDFHSPYGCSKGAADQYVLDYVRSFNIAAVVFRMSCIFGPHQMGTEDQGWVAHFLRQAIEGRPITIFGDGFQVRDVLFVEDLVDAFVLAQQHINRIAGQAFNIGGGSANTVSLVELLSEIEKIQGSRPRVETNGWRQGDQRYYVSDIRRFREATGWNPKVSAPDGIRRLHEWLMREYPMADSVAAASRSVEIGKAHAVLAH